MNFTLKAFKNGEKSVSVPQNTLDEVIRLLSKVDCTCIWSNHDNEYIKVHDIPEDLVEELKLLSNLAK